MKDSRGGKESLFQKVSSTQIWRSIFRTGGIPTTRRQRMMGVLNNVFLHLHPVRLPKHAVKVKYTWCMAVSYTHLTLPTTPYV